MKLCVIGNSHVGMLRAAVRELGTDAPELTFFAKAGAGLEKARIRGAVIEAEDRGLRAAQQRFGMPASLDVSRFDAVLLVAGTISVYSALRILQTHRVSCWPSSRRIAASGPGAARPQHMLVSEPAFVAALADEARAGLSHRFATAFRRASGVPIFVIPQPFPSERVFETARPQEYGFLRARRDGDGPAIAACLGRALDQAFAGTDGTHVLNQPQDTVAHGFTTGRRFTRDAVRVDGGTPQDSADLLHVGPAYGRRVLARVARHLEPARA